MPSQPHKERSDKVSSNAGTARKSKMKKRSQRNSGTRKKTDGIAMGGRRGVRGDFGTKKDRRELLEGGRHEKCT